MKRQNAETPVVKTQQSTADVKPENLHGHALHLRVTLVEQSTIDDRKVLSSVKIYIFMKRQNSETLAVKTVNNQESLHRHV
jgi:hypothetical protein